jgi:catalase-peroxidase
VLGGCAAVEQAAKDAGHDVTVPFAPGRTDASQEQTDVESFAVLEPEGRRVPQLPPRGREAVAGDAAARPGQPADADRSRDDGARRRHAALNANFGGPEHGVFTDRPGTLTNDFFVNLLDMGTEWSRPPRPRARVRGPRPRDGRGQVDRHRRRPRLRLELPAPGARGGLRSDDAKEKFVRDFVAAWDKVMNLDRFDCRRCGNVRAVELDPSSFEAAPEQMCGFTVESTEIVLIGRCSSCAATEPTHRPSRSASSTG